MNKVNLQTIYPCENGRFEIPLGNGTHHIFTNQKKAKAFLAVTNQFLTDRVYLLTRLYSDLYTKFRNEFYFTIHTKDHRNLEGQLDTINQVLKSVIDQAPMKIGHHYAFINLKKAVRFSLEFVACLKEHDKGRSNTMNTYLFNSLIETFNLVENDINNYGRLTASGYSSNPEHEIGAYTHRPTLTDRWFESQLKIS